MFMERSSSSLKRKCLYILPYWRRLSYLTIQSGISRLDFDQPGRNYFFLIIPSKSIDDQHTVSGITDITLDHGCSVHHIYIRGEMAALTGGNCRLGQSEKTLLLPTSKMSAQDSLGYSHNIPSRKKSSGNLAILKDEQQIKAGHLWSW